MVLVLNFDALLGLNGLVQTIGPATALEDATGELVDDLDGAVTHEVLLVTNLELLSLEGVLELVDIVGGDGVVEVGHAEQTLDLGDTGLGRHHGALFEVDFVVLVAHQRAGNGGELVVELGRVRGRTRNDERRTGLINQDGVDFVDDGVVVAALDHLVTGTGHVVSQVVKAQFGVGAVGDVALVGDTLLLELLQVRTNPADGQPEPTVDLAHPVRVTGGEVVVHGNDVDAFTGEGVQVHRQRRDERLTFTGLHFGDPAEVQGHTTHELDVVVALAEHAGGGLANNGEGLDHQVIQRLAIGVAGLELRRLGLQFSVAQRRHFVGQGINGDDEFSELTNPLSFTGSENLLEHAHDLPTLVGGLFQPFSPPSFTGRWAGFVDHDAQSGLQVLTWSLTPHPPARTGPL